MEEGEIVKCLTDSKFRRRVVTLNFLEERISKSKNENIVLRRPYSVFKALSIALQESLTESVKIQCLNIMSKIIPTLKRDLDDCMTIVLPMIFSCFTSTRSSIRKHALEVWEIYLKQTSDFQSTIDSLVLYGLDSSDPVLNEFVVDNLFVLIDIRNLKKHVNYQGLVDGMLKLYSSASSHARENIIQYLNVLKNCIGNGKYSLLLMNSPHHLPLLSENNSRLISGVDYLPKLGSLTNIFLSLFNVRDKAAHKEASSKLREVLFGSFSTFKQNIDFILKLISKLLSDYNHLEHNIVLDILKIVEDITEKLAYENMDYLELTVSLLVQHMVTDDEYTLKLVYSIFRKMTCFVPHEFFIASLFPYVKCDSPDLLRKCCLDCITMTFLTDSSRLGPGGIPFFGISAQLVQLLFGCLASSSVSLRLSALECLAVVVDRYDLPGREENDARHDRIIRSLTSQLDCFKDIKMEWKEKRILILAMKARICRHALPTFDATSGRIVYFLNPSRHKGFDVEWIKNNSIIDRRESHDLCDVQISTQTEWSMEEKLCADRSMEPEQYRNSPRKAKMSLIPRPTGNLPRIRHLGGSRQASGLFGFRFPRSSASYCSFRASTEGARHAMEKNMKAKELLRKDKKGKEKRDLISPVNVESREKKELKRQSSLKYSGRGDDLEMMNSRRQASCGPLIIQNSPAIQTDTRIYEYDLTDLKLLSECVEGVYERSDRIDEREAPPTNPREGLEIKEEEEEPCHHRMDGISSEVQSGNKEIIGDVSLSEEEKRHLEEKRLGVSNFPAERISRSPLPSFPWKSKRRLLSKKKFYMEEAQRELETTSPRQVPITNPSSSYNEALLGLSLDKWSDKCQALEVIKRLSLSHKEVIKPDIAFLTRTVLKEVRNLRSKVSLLAVVTLGEMFCAFQKFMDKEADESTKVLLTKCGDSNKFIREEAEKSLCNIADNVSLHRSISALVPFGTSHKNASVQQTSSRLLMRILDVNGAEKIFQNKEAAEKFLPASMGFLLAGSQMVRDQGHMIVRSLMMTYPDFNKVLYKLVPENVIANVKDKLDVIKSTLQNGVRLSKTSSRGDNCSPQTNLSKLTWSAPELDALTDRAYKNSPNSSNVTGQTMSKIESNLNSENPTERLQGLESLEQMLQNKSPRVFGVSEVLDGYLKCLSDSDDGVLLKALEIFDDLLVLSHESIGGSVGEVVAAMAANLRSPGERITMAACKCLDSIMESFEPFSLLPVFIETAMKCKRTFKADFVKRVHYLYSESVGQRPVQSGTIIYKFLWYLLEILVRHEKFLRPPDSRRLDVSTSQPGPPLEGSSVSIDGTECTSASEECDDLYTATQSLLFTVSHYSLDDLELRCRKLKPRNLELVLEMLNGGFHEQNPVG